MFIFNKISAEKLPSEIKSKNIFNATLEIRYDLNSVPSGVLMGALYNNEYFKKNYNIPQQTPIFSISQQMVQQDSNLQSTIDFLLTSKNETYQIGAGPGTLALYIPNFKYSLWEKAFSEMEKMLNTINSILPSIKDRIGVRFINFFSDKKLSKSLRLDCKIFNKNILTEPFSLTCVNKIKDDTEMKLTITNPVILEQLAPQEQKDGFIIDIDVITTKKIDSLDNIKQIFNQNHLFVKRAFFGLFDDKTIEVFLNSNKKRKK